MITRKRILYGICGIGLGHTYRQLPLIEYFARMHDVVIFAYGESFSYYRRHFGHTANITVLEVSVPFYVGGPEGIDFAATAERSEGGTQNVTLVNARAIAEMKSVIGRPDIVLSDYEPTSALVAYAFDVPLITIDQQSKYLMGGFPEEINGFTSLDEVERLRMFFPKAEARIACSFFVVDEASDDNVTVVPPVLRPSIQNLIRSEDESPSILVYFSSQQPFTQSLGEILTALARLPQTSFHMFIPTQVTHTDVVPDNVTIYCHGDNRWNDLLSRASGIVSTAGHGLLSEAMHLGVPVYAVPLGIYEQQMNAQVIDEHEFGVAQPSIQVDRLAYFIASIPRFRENIERDDAVLLRGSGEEEIIRLVESYL